MSRIKPYTEIGLKRLKCIRCGGQASAQWQACADNNIWRPMCTQCDILVNKIVLEFLKPPNWEEKINLYKLDKGIV